MTHTNKITEEGKELYEIGLHIVSSLAEEQVQDEFNSLKSNLAKHAEVTAEKAPELMQLAYTITKNIDRKNQRFDSAYFGWIKVIATSQAIIDIKEMIDGNTAVLRSIIVKTVENAEEAATRFAEKEAEEAAENDADTDGDYEKPKSKPKPRAKVAEEPKEDSSEKTSEEDLDEKIDELIK